MLSHRDSDYVGKFTSNFRIQEICQQQQATSQHKVRYLKLYHVYCNKSGSRYHHTKPIEVKMKDRNVRFFLEFFSLLNILFKQTYLFYVYWIIWISLIWLSVGECYVYLLSDARGGFLLMVFFVMFWFLE